MSQELMTALLASEVPTICLLFGVMALGYVTCGRLKEARQRHAAGTCACEAEQVRIQLVQFREELQREKLEGAAAAEARGDGCSRQEGSPQERCSVALSDASTAYEGLSSTSDWTETDDSWEEGDDEEDEEETATE